MDETKELCLNLLQVDSETEVISLLQKAGYWDNPSVWRLIGDRKGNYGTVGAQQSRSEAALAEKISNAIDARLINECLVSGIDPKLPEAPRSIREAVKRFFENDQTNNDGGMIENWDNKKRLEVSKGITVAVTGEKRNPCITISDIGEGQTADMIHNTFLSIDKENKLSIFFVQGRFNMGGTGVLEFCGKHNLQLIITRRNPNVVRIMGEKDPSSDYWGFTIVRIESPPENFRNSIYTYLAPIEAENCFRGGRVLRFRSKSLPLMPEGNKAYVREVEWGSTIKMYNYDMKGFASSALRKDGLLSRLEAAIPEPALPVRIHECRDYGGHPGSFDTTMTGLTVRLNLNKYNNLEDGFPDSVPFMVNGEEMVAKIYAFQKGKAETYRTNEGIIFTYYGQTHGVIPKTFFSRQNVKMGYLADSLLVIVDCSNISYRAREILFMSSKDRLRNKEFRTDLEEQLEEIISHHHGLRELKDRRKSQEIAERLDDSKPLENILEDILKSSPSLAALFLQGKRLPRPHKPGSTGGGNGGKGGSFEGKPHPTYFKFKDIKYGELLQRNCELERRCRIAFETDVENSYFERVSNKGRFIVEVLENGWEEEDINWNVTLHNGTANTSITIPEDAVVGDKITLQFTVKDDTLLEPFVNVARVVVYPKIERPGGGVKPSTPDGGGEGNKPDERPSGIQLPKHKIIREQQWNDIEPPFDRYSACRVIIESDDEYPDKDTYEFYINGDNIFLKTDMKANSKEDPKLYEAKFVYGNILIGLALLREYREQEEKRQNGRSEGRDEKVPWNDDFTVEDYVKITTRAMAPFILPIIPITIIKCVLADIPIHTIVT